MGGAADPRGITTGPDGALWFAEGTDDKIGRVTTGLSVTDEFSVSGNNMRDITAGPDGNLWFTKAGAIGRITTAGVDTDFPTTAGQNDGNRLGPDGNIWFTASANPGAIGRITTSATPTITLFTTRSDHQRRPARHRGRHRRQSVLHRERESRADRTDHDGGRDQRIHHRPDRPLPGRGASRAEPTATSGSPRTRGISVGRLNVAPGAVTDPATQIHASDAMLAGTVTPRSQATTYSFEWGLTIGYGSSTATSSAGSGASAQAVTTSSAGSLPPRPTTSAWLRPTPPGRRYGADRTFTTLAPAPFAPPRCRHATAAGRPRRAVPAAGDAARVRQVGDDRQGLRRDPRAAPGNRGLPPALRRLDGARRDDDRRHARRAQADERPRARAASCRPGGSGAARSRSARRAASSPPPCSR